MSKNFPETYEHMRKMMGKFGQDNPAVMGGFGKLHQAAVEDGVLDPKVKELIALGIAISVRCEGCIAFHVHDALEAGATREEISEAVGVAVLMGGGPSVMYGCEAMEALEQFAVETVSSVR